MNKRAPGHLRPNLLLSAAAGICALTLVMSACGSDAASPTSAPAATSLAPTGGDGALPPPPLEQRVAASDLIVTGTVESMDDKEVRITVDEVVSGDAEVGATISVSADLPNAVGLIKAGDDGVWLIDTTANPPVLQGGGPYDSTVDAVREVLNE